ncbi:MAG: class I SAM-dependent DNA methyltransferase [Bacteroidota bacterium]
MTGNFQLYSRYYDLLYRDKPYREEADYVLGTLQNIDPEIKTILELGCGSGAHARFFSGKGFAVTGIDRSAEMIREANEKMIPGFEALQGNITDFQLEKKFDCAVSLFHVISYLVENDELLSCFRSVNRHLEAGGLFLFDCWFTPGVYNLKPEKRTKHFENEELKVERASESFLDLEKNTVAVHFEVQITDKRNWETQKQETLHETHLMRHFSIPEIGLLASLAGFRVLKTEEFLSGKAPGLESWAICFVLQKTRDL